MDTLNRDCLSQIFLNLDFIERVRLEHVCRMFYYVLHQQSTFCDNVKLDISQFLINNSTDYYQQVSIDTHHRTNIFFTNFGRSEQKNLS
ncbi:hypothetical protein OESDEN_17105 [Oesophagostomum dentatum]|uniref:F-box domain-containing protein n=1 Tax=Oesophagostomum dentatum TaxID=61180 RepID=A0A0B1SD42_OESDE|nr:hypothetical protein OESDEN_17105 [Oesophagostomum dentatum]